MGQESWSTRSQDTVSPTEALTMLLLMFGSLFSLDAVVALTGNGLTVSMALVLILAPAVHYVLGWQNTRSPGGGSLRMQLPLALTLLLGVTALRYLASIEPLFPIARGGVSRTCLTGDQFLAFLFLGLSGPYALGSLMGRPRTAPRESDQRE